MRANVLVTHLALVSRSFVSHSRTLLTAAPLLAAFLALPGVRTHAQTAQLGYTRSTVASSFANAGAVAKDGSGNLYVADYSTNVYKVPYSNGSYGTPVSIATGFRTTTGVAVDGSGNVFVTDDSVNVYEVPFSSGSYGPPVSIAATFNQSSGVAVDGSGNVFVADNSANVYELPYSSGTYGTPVAIASTFNKTLGVAVDSGGNIFVADNSTNVYKVPFSGGSYGTPTAIVSSGILASAGIALDSTGNLYIADGSSRLYEVTYSGGSYGTPAPIIFDLSDSVGVTVDVNGNLYVADLTANLYKESLNQDFQSVAVGSSVTQTLTFAFTGGGTIGVPQVLTQGAANLDFTDATTGTCTSNGTSHTYAMGDTCTVDVTFKPAYSGTRVGSVALLNASGSVIATASAYGVGTGPQAAFNPGSVTGLNTGIATSTSVVADAGGNFYVADPVDGKVYKVPASGPVTTVGGGFAAPAGVAINGAGDLFITDNTNGTLTKVPAGCIAGANDSTCTVALVTGLAAPFGVAVDKQGDVFVVETTTDTILEYVAVNGTIPASPAIRTIANSGINANIRGIAVDGNGNLFAAVFNGNELAEFVAINGVIPENSNPQILSNISGPAGVAVDAAGDLYYSDWHDNSVHELVAVNGTLPASPTDLVLASGLSAPEGLAVDGLGNVIISGQSVGYPQGILRFSPEIPDFPATAVGSTSAAETLTLQNIGNQPLSFSADPALDLVGGNPDPNFLLGTTNCTNGAGVVAGGTCTVAVSFTPQSAAALTGSVTLTDNNLNATNATQILSLSGTGGFAPQATVVIASEALTVGQVSVDFTPVAGSGGTGTLSYSVNPSLPAGLSFNTASGAITGSPSASSATLTYTVTVTDANNLTGSATFMLTVNAAPQATQAIASKTLTVGQTGVSFTPVTGSGGTPVLSYSISPSLPAGLNLNTSTGAITGSPSASSATLTYTVTVTDANSVTAQATFILTVNAAPQATQAIASKALTVGQTGVSFTPVTGSGGTPVLSYSISPSLPAGLSFNSSTGAVTGSPTAPSATLTYTVTVTDANSVPAQATFILTVNAAPQATQAIVSKALTVGQTGVSFTPVTGSGGTQVLSYSISPSLPAGLNLNTSTGAITGSPSASSATLAYTVTVTDANSVPAQATFILTVNAAPQATQAIVSKALTVGQTGVSFTPVTGSGGTPVLSYSISPSLPAGLSFNSSTGAITGSPSASSATLTYTVTVTDANSVPAQATFILTVNVAPQATQLIPFETLTTNQAGVNFTPVAGSGGANPLSYSISPILPPGLSLNTSTGTVTGSPLAPSAAIIYTVTVTDLNGVPAQASFTLVVNVPPQATQAIASATLTAGQPGVSFTPVTGSGGTGTLSYSIAPILPSGLIFDPSSGAVTGAPLLVAPPLIYIVTVTDANGVQASATFMLTVNPAPQATVQTPSETLVVGQTVNFTPVAIAGGTGPLLIGISPSLPAGLGFNIATGAITGTPTAVSAQSTYTVSAMDANGVPAQGSFTLTVTVPPNFVVNVAGDDTGAPVASNCTAQSSTTTNATDSACSLRDALAASSAAGGAGITFDSAVFESGNSAAANTITLGSNGTLTIPANTTITGPTAVVSGVTANLVTVDGNHAVQVFAVNSGSNSVAISNLNIANGSNPDGLGGGISNQGTLTVTHSTFTGNAAWNGGGISNQGTLTVSNSTFSGNSVAQNGSGAGGGGGGLLNGNGMVTVSNSSFTGNQAGTSSSGGALATYSGGTTIVTGSAFSGNTAASDGGAVFNLGALTVTNSTFAGNSAQSDGGAISSGLDGGTVTLTNSTISGNWIVRDQAQGGGLTNWSGNDADVKVSNSIISGNWQNGSGGTADDTFGSYTDNGGNVLGSSSVNLAPLGNYGGLTQTMIPQPGSAAICAGTATPTGVTLPSTDQRGLPITGGGYCPSGKVDSGAVQTNYALSWTQQPGTVVAAATDFSVSVTLKESGQPSSGATIPLSVTAGSLTSGASATTGSNGQAVYTLQATAGTKGVLTATLTLAPASSEAGLARNPIARTAGRASEQTRNLGISLTAIRPRAEDGGSTPAVTLTATSKSFSVTSVNPYGYLDTARDATTGSQIVLTGDKLHVSGWAVDLGARTPASTVQIMIDGNLFSTATPSLSRPDVAAAMGSTYLNSGWVVETPAASLSIGTHTVTAIAVTTGGLQSQQLIGSITIRVASSTAPPIGYLDEAQDATTGSSTITNPDSLHISGWAADSVTPGPATAVTVYIDGTAVGTATLGVKRSDVAAAHGAAYLYTGWILNLTPAQLQAANVAAGTHTATAFATASNGERAQLIGSLKFTTQLPPP